MGSSTAMLSGCACLRSSACPMRDVIVQAAAAGLEVEVTGTGTARDQAPAAGTQVTPGTRIVVRAAR